MLFSDYITAMLERRARSTRFTPEQTVGWLAWLSRNLLARSQPILYIERMQPDWLPPADQQRFDHAIGTLRGALVGSAAGIIVGIGLPAAGAMLVPRLWAALGARGFLLSALIGGLAFAAGFALLGWRAARRGPTERIDLVEQIIWSRTSIRNGALLGTAIGLLAGIVFGFVYGALLGIGVALALGATLALLIAVRDASWRARNDKVRTRPNQGVARSTAIALAIRGALGLASGSALALVLGTLVSAGVGAVFGALIGLALAIFMLLFFGGETYLKHWLLRALLWRRGLAPWDYERFLDYGVERVLLRRVGGGYIFIHRLLMEHLATPRDDQFS